MDHQVADCFAANEPISSGSRDHQTKNRSHLKEQPLISCVAILASILVWSQMKQEAPQLASSDDSGFAKATDFQNELQQQSLEQDLINQTFGLSLVVFICRKGV
ncbi:hypothetical protein OK016_01790 [Vibrio chagasii]|nr:hypothetical protein [Vibrio chagasii]